MESLIVFQQISFLQTHMSGVENTAQLGQVYKLDTQKAAKSTRPI